MVLKAQYVFLSGLLLLLGLRAISLVKKQLPDQNQVHALYKLNQLAETPFDRENAEHAQLLKLVASKFSITDDWRQMGFQRRDTPTTDFRSFGILSLHCLIHTDAHRRMQQYMTGTPQCLPFAITLLNIGHEVLQKMKNNPQYLAHMLFGEKTEEDFAFYVDSLLLRFEKYWLAQKPENIMTYNIVWAQFAQRHLR